MKIVIVLCSLATFAIAVPVFQENVFESSLNNQPLSTKRERKSPVLDITPRLLPEYGIDQVIPHNSKKLGHGTSVEAKSFRRPIIIKRKLGYHVYRDSDEEMAYAEPGEKCTEQVKFKLCDPEPASSSTNGMKSPFKCVNNYKTDNEMENSIKMARKAVEHLQKDLKRMENFSPKMANLHIEDIESNNGLHHDIEIAREALEHIEQNFESVNFKENKVNELQIRPKSQDVERLTRWREAIENIHKNFEIVKNIEDAFKTDNQFSLLRSDNEKAVELEEPTNTGLRFHVQNKFTNDNLENNDEVNNEDKTLKSASNKDETAEFIPRTKNIYNIDKDVADDMFLSPTENREKKVQLHSDSLKSEINYKDASIRSDASEIESTNTNKYANEDSKLQFSKSVPESQSDPMLSTTLNVDINDDQHSQKQEASMRSSASRSEKIQLNEYQDEPKHATSRLGIENNSDDTTSQSFKSVPETNPFPIETLPLEKGDITNDEESHKTEASMRSSESQNEKMQSNENQEVHERLSMGLDNERHPEGRPWQYSKSVPELAYDSVVSMPKEEFVITDDPHAHTEEASMRSSDSQNEKLQLNDYQEEPKYASTRLDIENNSDDTPETFFKSAPELQPYPSESMPSDKEHNNNDKQSHREETSMRSSESQNEKWQLNEYQEEPKHATSRLVIENSPDDTTSQSFKSVPEMKPFPIEALPLVKEDITNDEETHKTEASVRSSGNQNEKMQSNENQEVHERLSMGLDDKLHPEGSIWQYSKSVPELAYDSMVFMPTEEVVITDDPHAHTEEASMRSSDSQNKKLQLNDYQEEPKYASTRLDIENNSDDIPATFFKSAPELQPYPSESMPLGKEHNNNDKQTHREETSMRSSESQNEKWQLNEYQEEPKHATSRLVIENSPDDTTSQSFKSAPEMKPFPIEALPLVKEDITNDEETHKTEASVRSSGNQNEKIQSNENQEVHERLSMVLDDELHPEGRIWQYSKSVPELAYDSMVFMPTEEVVITDDPHAHTEEASMRSSDSQNEKLLLNDYHEEPKFASKRLDIENNSDDTTAQFIKSVFQLQPHSSESMPSDQGHITNDHWPYREETSVRSSDSKSEKMQPFENQEVHELLRSGLDIERHPERHTWQYSKSVPQLAYDSMVSMPTENLVITDDPHALREEVSTRSSENQNEKLEINDYQDEPKFASTRLDIENNSDDTTANFFKSVPELQEYPSESMPSSKERITDDQQSHKVEASMRSSDSPSEKIQSIENQEVHELLPLELEIERHPEERTWQGSKSVPKLAYDSVVSMPTEEVVITDDPHAHTEEASMRSSDSQNEKLQLNDYQEEPKIALTRSDIEISSDDTTGKFFKSVPEYQAYPSESKPSSKERITNDQQSLREEASMRSSDSLSDKMQTIENQEVHELSPLEVKIERHPEERTWQDSKSVPELAYDSMLSMPTEEVVFADDPHAHREEASMRSSKSQNEKIQSSENQEVHELLPMGLDIERHPEDRTWQYSKSVPELAYDSVVSMPTEEFVNTDDSHAHTEEDSMRSSDSQNEKLQLNDYQEEPKYASTRLDIENNSDDISATFFKSVPKLQTHPSESMPSDKDHISNDQQSHREKPSVRSSESQSETMQTVENQEVDELLPLGLKTERHPEERTWQNSKSVPELIYDSMMSMPTEEVVITDDSHAHAEEASMRSSDSLNEKLQLNDYLEEPKFASTKMDIENNFDDTTAKFFKSVSELQPYPSESMPSDKEHITTDQQSQASMRSSDSQNENMQSNKYKEEPKYASTRLDIENNSDDTTAQSFKSVPEVPFISTISIPTENVVRTDDQNVQKEEANMRSSESQNEKLQLDEYKEEPKYASTRLDVENNSDDTTAQSFKSVPEVPFNPTLSMPSENVVSTDNQNVQKEEASMRSSESQYEKLQLDEFKEEPKYASTRLDIENNSVDTTAQSFKSVPEVPFNPTLSMPSENVVSTDNQNVQKEEASMRSSESQYEKLQLDEFKEEPKYASTRLDIENYSDDTTAQFFKSVPEVPSSPTISIPTENVVSTDDQNDQKQEASMRSSDSQNEKMQSNEYKEEPKYASTRLDIENYSDDTTAQFFKSVPELPSSPTISIPTENVVSTDDQNVQREEVSMRSSESHNQKLQSNEYQEEPRYASTRMDIGTSSDDATAESFKSVLELQPFLIESLPLEKGDITNDQQSYKKEASMRSSETQNEKMQSNENQEAHELLPTGLDIESNPEERTWQYSKSVPELRYDQILSMPTNTIISTDDHHANKEEETSMRSSVSENEKLQLNENQKAHEPLMIRLDMTNHPEDHKWPFSKSVPEVPYDPMLSMPSDNVEITDEHHFLNERNMRLSQNQNERTQSDENRGLFEFLPTKLGDARLSQTQNERQQIYFNHHYEPHSSRLDFKNNFEDDSLAPNKLRFNYIHNPTKEQTATRLSQNQNDDKEIQYPSTSFSLSNDMNRDDNVAHLTNDFVSVAQPQHLHENRNPMLRLSNERQYLNHNFKTLPEYKLLPQTSEFEFSNGPNAHNEHINMRVNQEQSRDSEPMENQYLHNSHSMRWNTENHQDHSPNTFKSNLDFDHTLHKSNKFGNEQFIPHEPSKTVNTLEYRTRPTLFSDHILDDTQSSRWFQTKQHSDHFANYYKTIPEVQEEYSNPHFREHLRRVAVNHRLNDADTFTSHDYPSSRARLHDHMQKYHQEMSSNTDSSMERGMHMSMREPFAKSDTEFNNMQFNHPHGTPRFGTGLPVAGVGPGAVGVYPTGNAGGCGIPLLLSCSPSVISGSLARQNIAGPIFKSVDENFKYYIKRDAKNIEDVLDIKGPKASLPHSHGTGVTHEI